MNTNADLNLNDIHEVLTNNQMPFNQKQTFNFSHFIAPKMPVDKTKDVKMNQYVKDISFVVSDYAVRGIPNIIDVDMNAGSGGKYIYPYLTYTQNPDEAITGFAFIQNDQVTPHYYYKINQDLNERAKGTFNYLCYTKLGQLKITAIDFVALSDPLNQDDYKDYKVFRQNLNTGTKRVGKYIYLLYKIQN